MTEQQDLSKQLFDYIKRLDLSKPGTKPELLKRIRKTITKAKKVATQQNKQQAKKPLSLLQKRYREYFQTMLAMYKVDSPAQIKPEEKKKEFFSNIKKYWNNGEGPKDKWKEKIKLNEGRIVKTSNIIKVLNRLSIEQSIIKENKIRTYISKELRKHLNS